MNDPLQQSRFAADATDIVHYTTRSIDLELLKDGATMLSEHYSPDTEHYVHIRGLDDIFANALYGQLATGDQPGACARFTIRIDSQAVWSKTVYSMLLRNLADPLGQKNVMAVAERSACHPGTPFLVTVIGQAAVTLTAADGSTVASTVIGRSADDIDEQHDDDWQPVTTADCDPRQLFPDAWQLGAVMHIGSEMTVRLLPPLCSHNSVVRFLNRYDMPETVVADYIDEKPAAEDSASVMNGRRTRFAPRDNTEYTLHSGPLPEEQMMETWHDLLTSRRAQLLHRGQWVDIVVTKGNYTRHRRPCYGTEAQITFQTARLTTIL